MSSESEHLCIVGIERCGCVHGVHVLDGSDDANAYKMAARMANNGAAVSQVTVAAFRELNGGHVYCAEHRATDGPPWWPRNARKSKREREAPPVGGLGL